MNTDSARPLRKVCIIGSSQDGRDPVHARNAVRVGQLVGARGIEVFYGGGDVGLMGRAAHAARHAGSRVMALITRDFLKASWYKALAEIEEIVVDGVAECKGYMAREADMAIVLRGGIGSLDEFIHMLAVQDQRVSCASEDALQPIIVLDPGRYYADAVLPFIARGEAEGFVRPGRQQLVRFVETVEELEEALDEYCAAGRRPANQFRLPSP